MSNFLSTSKGKITIGIILFIIILSGAIYYFMYGSSDAKYSRSVKNIVSHINSSNKEISSTYKYLDNGKKSFDKVKSYLEESKKQIDSALKTANSTTPLDNYKDQHKKLTNGINSNKLLIEQSIAVLDNYSSNTVKDSISKLYEHLSSTVGYYEKFNYKDFKINISNDLLNFPDKLGYYVDILVKETTGNTSKNSAALSFINDLKTNLSEIDTIKTSIEDNITSVKNGKTSPNQLKIFISSKLNELSSVIDKVNNLSSPPELKELQTLFISTGVLYEDYLKAFKSTLESSKEKDSTTLIDSSISMNKESLENYNSKKASLLSLIKEKEASLR